MQKFIVSLIAGIALSLSNYYFSKEPAFSYKVEAEAIKHKIAEKGK